MNNSEDRKNIEGEKFRMFKSKKIFLAATILALLVGGVVFWKAGSTSGTTAEAEFDQQLRNAIGEVNFASSSNAAEIDAAADNMANFIFYRSGVQLSQDNKDSLRQAEQSSLSQSKKISQAQLVEILTEVAFERLVTLTDTDINNMAEILRGFTPPNGLPSHYQHYRDNVRLRADGEGRFEPSVFISQIKASRDAFINGTSSTKKGMTRTALQNRITYEVSQRVGYLSRADPNFFGGPKGMTPMKAVFISYSVVSDDLLSGNQAELQQNESDLQQVVTRFGVVPYPGPQTYTAYGVNGYLYSSPTNLLFDDATTARIITLIRQEGGI